MERILRIEKRIWAPDDYYLVVPEIQVFEEDGFQKGMEVRVTIEYVAAIFKKRNVPE